MITEVWGDAIKMLQNGEIKVLVHYCNCFCTMGGGIAFGIAKTFPEAALADKKTKHGDINKLGTILPVKIIRGNIIEDNIKEVIVVNSYTQFTPGKDVSYAAIELCLIKINQDFEGKKITMPMIGAGIAGGDFLIIRQMIKNILVDVDVTIIYWDGDKEKFNNEFPK